MNIQTLPGPVHIISPFSSWATEGGVWWHALEIYEALKDIAQVELWTELEPSPKLSAYPIQKIRPFRGEQPRSGTLIFVGMAQLPGSWYDHVTHDRVMLECTMFAPAKLYRALNRLSFGGKIEVSVGYTSELIKRLCGVPGRVRIPMQGMETFFKVERKSVSRPFTIGKVSRDSLLKHHFRDIPLYKKLVQNGCQIRIVGGTCLTPYLDQQIEGLELLSEMPRQELPEFLAGLDCFFYRTPLHCPESIGSVVLEAMAAGLPIVAHRQGGYRDIVSEGETGYLFDTDEQAYEILRTLSKNPHLVEQMGRNSREALYRARNSTATWTSIIGAGTT